MIIYHRPTAHKKVRKGARQCVYMCVCIYLQPKPKAKQSKDVLTLYIKRRWFKEFSLSIYRGKFTTVLRKITTYKFKKFQKT